MMAPTLLELTRAVTTLRSAVKGTAATPKKVPPQVSGLVGLTILRAMPEPPVGPASTVGTAPP